MNFEVSVLRGVRILSHTLYVFPSMLNRNLLEIMKHWKPFLSWTVALKYSVPLRRKLTNTDYTCHMGYPSIRCRSASVSAPHFPNTHHTTIQTSSFLPQAEITGENFSRDILNNISSPDYICSMSFRQVSVVQPYQNAQGHIN